MVCRVRLLNAPRKLPLHRSLFVAQILERLETLSEVSNNPINLSELLWQLLLKELKSILFRHLLLFDSSLSMNLLHHGKEVPYALAPESGLRQMAYHHEFPSLEHWRQDPRQDRFIIRYILLRTIFLDLRNNIQQGHHVRVH